MTDDQWKESVRRMKDPRELLGFIGSSEFRLGVDPYYGDLWDTIFMKARELAKE